MCQQSKPAAKNGFRAEFGLEISFSRRIAFVRRRGSHFSLVATRFIGFCSRIRMNSVTTNKNLETSKRPTDLDVEICIQYPT